MTNLQIRPTNSEAVILSMNEEAAADWYRQQGMQIFYHQGHYWKQTKFGFYEPINLLARLTVKQATCPKKIHLGFRASLCEADAAAANGSIPIHLLSDVEGYNLQSLSANRRNHLKRCHKRAKILQLLSPELLEEQGYEVFYSATIRFGGKVIPKKVYLSQLAKHIPSEQRYVFAGLINDKLGGYMTTYVVDGTAYIERALLATEALSAYIGTGLVFEFVQACRRSGKIREIVYGYHTPTDPALSTFKEGMGFPVRQIPAKVAVNPLIDPIFRWRYSSAYYFLTGKYAMAGKK
ncbi:MULTISPECIES: hypothetical protein [unclassified Tolypothrix]|uniref:hypothetical protein n=1 Tax=unclassified Tolypothrix TaxID=2649714 RepID=UPI0005EAB406|nr:MULTISPECIES: hypothetical protein [unclassified Tolypothrix]EKE98864.1 hypothetical protein FDUTEX481_03668 [Tolypothrix sp. PCC 7601]BAY90303.1 hypothetical protein NIES3275_23150 [Microchaete diplosiphon NIES-3275]